MQNEKSVEQIIGKRIQKIRQAKGYTQQQFAEVIGLSTNYLSDIERGKSSARLDKLVAIINALDVQQMMCSLMLLTLATRSRVHAYQSVLKHYRRRNKKRRLQFLMPLFNSP